jgi:hypothetical protein
MVKSIELLGPIAFVPTAAKPTNKQTTGPCCPISIRLFSRQRQDEEHPL